MEAYGIHWFRRDLRIAGNPALQWNWKRHGGRVLGLFCFDRAFLSRPDFSANRFQFFLETLKALEQELERLGGGLLFLDVGPSDAFPRLFEQLGEAPAAVSWNRDYEPFAVERDSRMAAWLGERGVAHHTAADHCLIEPQEISKPGGEPYQVFTPFSKRWLELFRTDEGQARLERQRPKDPPKNLFRLRWADVLASPPMEPFEAFCETNRKHVSIPLPPAGERAARAALETFRSRLPRYAVNRDRPDVDGTSRLSPYFKNGSLTVAQAIGALGLGTARGEGPKAFLRELIWREFYYHVLGRFPHVEKEAFHARYRRIEWENRRDWFEAWKEGRTGFPIVDAGMRQLRATGWMHNRVRMIAASFLTKDLLVDWRWGERWFMEQLIDGDLAPNNGGWQWAASTGCDPQPYFRVFNPRLQGEKFDPDGEYIKAHIPELRHLPAKVIHAPPPDARGDYPAPIVDHAVQRDKAIALYRRLP